MKTALFFLFALFADDFSAMDKERLSKYPPVVVTSEQLYRCRDFIGWLERIQERGEKVPEMKKAKEDYIFWEALRAMQRPDTDADKKSSRLQLMKRVFPHYWNSSTHPAMRPHVDYPE